MASPLLSSPSPRPRVKKAILTSEAPPVSDLHPPASEHYPEPATMWSSAPAGCSVTPLARGSHDAAWPNFGRKIAVVASKSRTQSTNNGGAVHNVGAVAHFRRHQRVFLPSLSLF